MFLRWVNTELQKNSKKSKQSILLMGPRRVGKSTLLKSLFPSYKYITLDDWDEINYAKQDPKSWILNLGSNFIIDEVQRYPELAITIKWAIDEKKVHCILTGSTGLHLFEKANETLAGRIQIYYLPPACIGENYGAPITLQDFKKNNELQSLARRQFNEFIKTGGFPEILIAQNSEDKKELLNIYKNTYFTKDVADLNSIENVEGLRALYLALITGLSSRYDVSSLVKETGLSTPTVKKYLNTLIQTGLLFKLYGYHLSQAKRYISSAKSYFIDIGILHALSSDFSQGQLIESFVISEIEKRRRLGFINCDQLYYYESAGGREIDLILDEPHLVTAIEIKSGKSVSGRDLRTLNEFEIKNNKTLLKIIYYTGNEFYNEGPIQIRPIHSLFRLGRLN